MITLAGVPLIIVVCVHIGDKNTMNTVDPLLPEVPDENPPFSTKSTVGFLMTCIFCLTLVHAGKAF